jgi:apolipoprotein N-acyltransferase
MNLDGPRTLATRSGVWPEVVIVFGTVVALIGVLPLRRRRTRIDSDDVTVSEER